MRPADCRRAKLEALIVARVLAGYATGAVVERLDRARVSPVVFQLIPQIAGDAEPVDPANRTKVQSLLIARVRKVTVHELLLTSLDELVALLNALPPRPASTPAWTRDLERGLAGDLAESLEGSPL